VVKNDVCEGSQQAGVKSLTKIISYFELSKVLWNYCVDTPDAA
jgi:hypothetical protein